RSSRRRRSRRPYPLRVCQHPSQLHQIPPAHFFQARCQLLLLNLQILSFVDFRLRLFVNFLLLNFNPSPPPSPFCQIHIGILNSPSSSNTSSGILTPNAVCCLTTRDFVDVYIMCWKRRREFGG
ncbi:hypothetical protein WG66_003181, partial [Moniliophthora roreri]